MATSLSGQEMKEMVARHAGYEMAGDWAGALGTMTETPVYEYYPYRLRISGAEAITEAWIRLLALPCFDPSGGITVHSHEEFVGVDSIMTHSEWTFTGDDGVPQRTKVVVNYQFEGEQMARETMIMDASVMPFVERVLDEGFRALPGVELI
jgi:hypothetical protein